jgi:hypothetical protein
LYGANGCFKTDAGVNLVGGDPGRNGVSHLSSNPVLIGMILSKQ